MTTYRFTKYFEEQVMKKSSYLKKEWCIKVTQKIQLSQSHKNITGIVSGEGWWNWPHALITMKHDKRLEPIIDIGLCISQHIKNMQTSFTI
jgi:hypothetical protein